MDTDLPPLKLGWAEQPDDITCGPTCVAIVAAGIATRHGKRPFEDVLGVAAMCGTNETVGTIPEGVRPTLAGLGVHAVRTTGREAFEAALAESDALGRPLLLRTMTLGVKHWVVATGEREGDLRRVLDPWLGDLRLRADEIEALVSPREHETWTVDPDREPRELGIGTARSWKDEATALLAERFAHLVPGSFGRYLDAKADWDLSRALVVDGRLAGVYLLREGDASGHVGTLPSEMEGLRTVEGVALAVAPWAQGTSYGRLLRDQPRALGFEAVWGLQHKSLGNLDRWLAHRALLGETQGCWVTGRTLPPPAPVPAPAVP